MTNEQMKLLLEQFPYLWAIRQQWSPSRVDIGVFRLFDHFVTRFFPDPDDGSLEIWTLSTFWEAQTMAKIKNRGKINLASQIYQSTWTHGSLLSIVLVEIGGPIDRVLVCPSPNGQDLVPTMHKLHLKNAA